MRSMRCYDMPVTSEELRQRFARQLVKCLDDAILDTAPGWLPLIERALTETEREFAGIKVYSLPSVGEGGARRHIELGAKGDAARVEPAFERLRAGVIALGGTIG